MNQQAQRFADEWPARGFDFKRNGQSHIWFDWEEDGDPDLYIGVFSDLPENLPSRLYRNDGTGHFTDSSTVLAIVSPEIISGAQLADLDGDGRLDILELRRETESVVWRDNGDGTFTDIASALNLELPVRIVNGNSPDWHTEAAVADFDNDMDPDVFVTTLQGILGQDPPNQLWLNEAGAYAEVALQAGLTERAFAGTCSVGDLNGDGFLDIYIVNSQSFGQRDTLYLNNGNGNHWIEIDPLGIWSNRDAFGLRAWVTAGGVTQVQELYSFATHADRLHFGLASNEIVSEVRLRWPSGLEETYTDIPADQVFRPIEGASLPWGDRVGVILR